MFHPSASDTGLPSSLGSKAGLGASAKSSAAQASMIHRGRAGRARTVLAKRPRPDLGLKRHTNPHRWRLSHSLDFSLLIIPRFRKELPLVRTSNVPPARGCEEV